MTGGMILKREN